MDFGCGSGFVAVDFGLFSAGFCLGFVVARLLDFIAMPPLFGWIVVVV